MRRVLLLVLLAAVALAGCGSSSSGSSSPINTELSYFPAGSPFVISVATDPNSSAVKGAQALVNKFSFAAFGESALMAKLQQLGINYQSDIRPLFGNPVMLGVTSPNFSGVRSGSTLLAVWMTNDSGKLKALIKKLPGFHGVGSHNGATLYQAGGTTTLAVDDATAIIAPSQSAVDAALDRHAHGGGISSSDYTRAFSGLPQGTLIQAFGSLSGVLSQPSAAKAQSVPWVAALRSYAATVSANSSGLSFRYRLDTSGRSLTPDQVPLATGTSPANVAGNLPIGVGVQNPAHIAAFVEEVERITSPSSYADFTRREAASRAKTGADLNSLVKLLTGELIVQSDTHKTMGRAVVSDPGAATKTLAKLMRDPRSVFKSARAAKNLGGGFYGLEEPRQVITVGVVGNQLLVGKASPAELRSFAAAPTASPNGGQGSVAFRVGLPQLLQFALKRTPPKIVQTILGSLGDITGWASSSTSELTGSASLAVH